MTMAIGIEYRAICILLFPLSKLLAPGLSLPITPISRDLFDGTWGVASLIPMARRQSFAAERSNSALQQGKPRFNSYSASVVEERSMRFLSDVYPAGIIGLICTKANNAVSTCYTVKDLTDDQWNAGESRFWGLLLGSICVGGRYASFDAWRRSTRLSSECRFAPATCYLVCSVTARESNSGGGGGGGPDGVHSPSTLTQTAGNQCLAPRIVHRIDKQLSL